MKTDVKVDKSTSSEVRNSNIFRHSGSIQIKARTEFEGDTVELDGVYFNWSDGNHANNNYLDTIFRNTQHQQHKIVLTVAIA